MLTELNTDSLEREIEQNDKVLVQFSASWCGNCRIMKPKFKKKSLENESLHFLVIDAEKNPNSSSAKKNFRGILPYEYDNKGKPVPNYETIGMNQVFYNPEDGLFYERVAEEGIIGTDFRALDPFTYE